MSMRKRQAGNTVWRFFFYKYMGTFLIYVIFKTAQLFRNQTQPEAAGRSLKQRYCLLQDKSH